MSLKNHFSAIFGLDDFTTIFVIGTVAFIYGFRTRILKWYVTEKWWLTSIKFLNINNSFPKSFALIFAKRNFVIVYPNSDNLSKLVSPEQKRRFL